MIRVVLDGITQALAEKFQDCAVYGGQEVAQGLNKPCFFVTMTAFSQKPLPGSRYERRQEFEIKYYPRQEGDFEELYGIAERLFLALEAVDTEQGVVRGTNMRTSIDAGLLGFCASYNMIARAVKIPRPAMGSLKQKTGLG